MHRPEFVPVLVFGTTAAFQEGKRRSWRRPIKGILEKLKEGHKGRRKRRDVEKLELESSGVPGIDSSVRRNTGKRKTSGSGSGSGSSSSSSSSSSSPEERSAGKIPAVFASQIEATLSRANQEKLEEGGREKEGARRRSSRGATRTASKRKRHSASKGETTSEEGASAKRKRRALRALWGRVIGKLRGTKGGGGDGEGGEVEMRRLRMLKDLKQMVEERHGRELWGRAKAARHELDDGLLLR